MKIRKDNRYLSTNAQANTTRHVIRRVNRTIPTRAGIVKIKFATSQVL